MLVVLVSYGMMSNYMPQITKDIITHPCPNRYVPSPLRNISNVKPHNGLDPIVAPFLLMLPGIYVY